MILTTPPALHPFATVMQTGLATVIPDDLPLVTIFSFLGGTVTWGSLVQPTVAFFKNRSLITGHNRTHRIDPMAPVQQPLELGSSSIHQSRLSCSLLPHELANISQPSQAWEAFQGNRGGVYLKPRLLDYVARTPTTRFT